MAEVPNHSGSKRNSPVIHLAETSRFAVSTPTNDTRNFVKDHAVRSSRNSNPVYTETHGTKIKINLKALRNLRNKGCQRKRGSKSLKKLTPRRQQIISSFLAEAVANPGKYGPVKGDIWWKELMGLLDQPSPFRRKSRTFAAVTQEDIDHWLAKPEFAEILGKLNGDQLTNSSSSSENQRVVTVSTPTTEEQPAIARESTSSASNEQALSPLLTNGDAYDEDNGTLISVGSPSPGPSANVNNFQYNTTVTLVINEAEENASASAVDYSDASTLVQVTQSYYPTSTYNGQGLDSYQDRPVFKEENAYATYSSCYGYYQPYYPNPQGSSTFSSSAYNHGAYWTQPQPSQTVSAVENQDSVAVRNYNNQQREQLYANHHQQTNNSIPVSHDEPLSVRELDTRGKISSISIYAREMIRVYNSIEPSDYLDGNMNCLRYQLGSTGALLEEMMKKWYE